MGTLWQGHGKRLSVCNSDAHVWSTAFSLSWCGYEEEEDTEQGLSKLTSFQKTLLERGRRGRNVSHLPETDLSNKKLI